MHEDDISIENITLKAERKAIVKMIERAVEIMDVEEEFQHCDLKRCFVVETCAYGILRKFLDKERQKK